MVSRGEGWDTWDSRVLSVELMSLPIIPGLGTLVTLRGASGASVPTVSECPAGPRLDLAAPLPLENAPTGANYPNCPAILRQRHVRTPGGGILWALPWAALLRHLRSVAGDLRGAFGAGNINPIFCRSRRQRDRHSRRDFAQPLRG